MIENLPDAVRAEHVIQDLSALVCNLLPIGFLGVRLFNVRVFEPLDRRYWIGLRVAGKAP